jgi:hypothetical protein
VGGVTQTTTQAVQGVVNSLPKPAAPAQPAAPAATTQAAAPAATTAQPAAPAPSANPVQQVVQDTTSAVGGLLGGR